MGECKRKGEAYQKKLADEQELMILKAIFYVEGAMNLDRHQKRKLRAAGIMKQRRAFQKDSDSEEDEDVLIDEFKEER